MLAASEPYYYSGVGYSPEVIQIQKALNAKVGANLTVDGQFGPLTASAVKVFQSKNGLAVDGIVGPNTWNLLMASSAYAYETSPNRSYETVVSPIQPVGIQTPVGQQQYTNPIGPVPLPAARPSSTWFMWVGLAGAAYIMMSGKSRKGSRTRRRR